MSNSSAFGTGSEGVHVVSIGTFDGVHLGHRFLLEQAADRAHAFGIPLLAVTFEPNPSQVIRPDLFRGRLTTPDQKRQLIAAAGVSDVVVVNFTEQLMRTSPDDFMADLVSATSPVEVWVGEEFALGHRRSGDIAHLTSIGERLGYRLSAVPRREVDGEVVSSSRIRQLVLEGDAKSAARLLGYPYRVSGVVVEGAQVGRTIGFPTANVAPPSQLVPLADGIYATWATIDGESHTRPAMTYIGTRPALNTGERQIETNILDFEGDLYGKVLHTDFVRRLRPDADFPSVADLVGQLRLDEVAAREALGVEGEARRSSGH